MGRIQGVKVSGIRLESLTSGLLLGRRKRFFADVELDSGPVVAHCPNTGSMRSLLLPGTQAIVSHNNDPKRKLAYTLEALQLPNGTLAMVNTMRPNAQVALAISEGKVQGIPAGCKVEREVVHEPGSRFDLRITLPGGAPLWIEVKNVTLVEDSTPNIASFPDAVTDRGAKHLRGLVDLVKAGQRAAMFYLVNRTDAESFMPARHIDPTYASELQTAVNAGVEVFVYCTDIKWQNGTLHLDLGPALPWSLG